MFNAMTDGHYVVPIGGAQFVPPYMSYFNHVPHATSPMSEDASSSGPSSPVHSRFSSSSSASTSTLDNGEYATDAARAHLHYAKQMAQHTAAMWQKERIAIEKAKLDGTYTGNQTSRQNGNAKPPADAPAPQPSSPTSKCSLSSSSSGSSSSHRRFVSALASIPIFAAFHHSSSNESSPRGRSRIPKNRA